MDRKVWVGSIPSIIDHEELMEMMSQYGEIIEFFYKQDTAGSRGWAFITYETKEQSTQAILSIDGKLKFRGSEKPVGARLANTKPSTANTKSSPSNPLYPSSTPEPSFDGGAKLTAINGVDPYPPSTTRSLSTTDPPPPVENQSPPSSFIHLGVTCLTHTPVNVYLGEEPKALWEQYTSPEGHTYYFNTLTKHTQWERPIRPKELTLSAIGSKLHGPLGSNLFIFHVPNEWGDIDLLKHFSIFGNILSARVKSSTTGRNSGFGFVSYDNSASASAAITSMNGYSVGNKYLKVELKKGEENFLTNEA